MFGYLSLFILRVINRWRLTMHFNNWVCVMTYKRNKSKNPVFRMNIDNMVANGHLMMSKTPAKEPVKQNMDNTRFKFRVWNRMVERMQDFDFPEFERTCKGSGIAWQNIVIMQWTGLLDKNGVEIYEGDIVKDQFSRVMSVVYHRYRLQWFCDDHNNNFRFADLVDWETRAEDTNDNPYGHTGIVRVEIIGNIYEHPHLITSKPSHAHNI